MPKFLQVCATAGALLFLSGCLPEDTIVALQYDPDGNRLAIVSEHAGVRIVDIRQDVTTSIMTGQVDPRGLTWFAGGEELGFAAAPEGAFDIYVGSATTGDARRVSVAPSRESYPMALGNMLLYLSTESSVAELTTSSRDSATTHPALKLPDPEAGIVHPVLSPSGEQMAYFTFEGLCPQLYVANLKTGTSIRVADETEPFDLLTAELVWSPDGSTLAFLRGHAHADVDDEQGDSAAPKKYDAAARLMIWREDDGVSLVAENPAGIRSPRLTGDGAAVYVADDKLHRVSLENLADGTSITLKTLDLDLKLSQPAVSGAADEIAFAVANQLIGLTSSSLSAARVLILGLEEKFLLAEEYFRAGSSAKSYVLYEELAASVQRTRDPEMARFIYIANLRRLGRTKQAVAELEKLVEDDSTTATVPRQYLWRLLGYSYLLELDDLERARVCFQRYRRLTSDTLPRRGTDSTANALQILRQAPPEVSRLYAQAVKARLDGNFTQTRKLFGDLLTTAPEITAVRREYINALDGFDEEVYFFSPTQRPFQPTRFQRAEYLQHFVDTVSTGTALARNARLDLFLLRIEMGNYSRARALLAEAMTSAPETGRPEGILEVFRNYLETPEPQPWINAAMPEVFWHPEIRTKLEPMLTDPADRLLVAVAATKMALLEGNADAAREQANVAGGEWNRIPVEEQRGELAALYGRLLVFRAREAELRGLYAEAVAGYEQALQLLRERRADNFEMQEEIRYRAELLRLFIADYPDLPQRLRQVEDRTGTELINPTWNRDALQDGVKEYLRLYESTTATVKLWAAYEAGVGFGKLKLPDHARAAFMEAATDSAPAFLQRKAMVELAALDEYLQDPWNAARWYARVAAMPGTGEQTRIWCSYQIARLHISMGYKVGAAREALAVILSTQPESSLAIQAQELLITTSVR